MPHDLDDIYEYKTDHQYFTHTGTSNYSRFPISSDNHRNALFRNGGMHSLDEYASSPGRNSNFDTERYVNRLTQFDNSSFAKSLSSSISQSSVSNGGNSSSNSSRDKMSKSGNHHHHHSIQEMIKHFSKKVHIWPRHRHESINESTSNSSPLETNEEAFRSRSRSLDVPQTRKILDDCESTYRIYNTILKEGN